MIIYTKPHIFCICLHQRMWEKIEEGVYHCSHCDGNFFYPTKMKNRPHYDKPIVH